LSVFVSELRRYFCQKRSNHQNGAQKTNVSKKIHRECEQYQTSNRPTKNTAIKKQKQKQHDRKTEVFFLRVSEKVIL